MTVIPDWLARIHDDSRPICSAAWAFETDGSPHLVKTNGHVIVALRGAHGGTEPTPDIAAMLTNVFQPSRRPSRDAGVEVELAALRTFIGGPDSEDKGCESCRGTGTQRCPRCRGRGVADCECECGHVHTVPCDECEGHKVIDCLACADGPAIISVRVGPVSFNARAWRLFLGHIPGDRIMIALGGPLTTSRGTPRWLTTEIYGDWGFVLIMPTLDVVGAHMPEFPIPGLTPALPENSEKS